MLYFSSITIHKLISEDLWSAVHHIMLFLLHLVLVTGVCSVQHITVIMCTV